MPIYQINIWICEVCEKTMSTTAKVFPFYDDTVEYPNKIEWDYIDIDEDEKLACPECVTKYKSKGVI